MAAGSLDELLESLRGASASEIRRALPALANFNVVVPVIRFKNLNDPQGTRRIQVVHRQNDDRREVAVFSSEDLLLAWAKDDVYQCFSVAAGDLALTLPSESWLVFDAGTANELILEPELVQVLAWGEETSAAEPPPPRKEQVPAAQPQTAATPARDGTATISIADVVPEAAASARTEPEVDPEKLEEQLRQDLEDLFKHLGMIDEAYLVKAPGLPTTYLLGVLAAELRPEARFALIEEIAQRSQKYFGEAGAIEVYDDLRLSSSKSWELFQTYIPFFVRDDRATGTESESLAQQVEEEHIPDASPGLSTGGKRVLWGLRPPFGGRSGAKEKSE